MALIALEELGIAEQEVAVTLTHSMLDGGHLGLAFHTEEGPRVLHLAWHKDIRLDCFGTDPWLASKLAVPNAAGMQIVAILRMTADQKPPIQYGINLLAAKGSFSLLGGYEAPEGSDGLTCATFVTEHLAGAGIRLVDEDTWPETEANKEWGKTVCQILKHTGADESHVATVRANTQGLRLRPFEVAGVSTLESTKWPVKHPEAHPLAVGAEEALNTGYPRTPERSEDTATDPTASPAS